MTPPIAAHLPRLIPHVHARFELTSASSPYVTNDGELHEAIERWETLVDELVDNGDSLLVVSVDWTDDDPPGPREQPKGLQPVLPDYAYWRSVPYDAAADYWLHLYLSEVACRPGALNDLFEQVASDCCDGVMITNFDLEWIIAPAWDHTDVYGPSNDERNALAERHADWLMPKE